MRLFPCAATTVMAVLCAATPVLAAEAEHAAEEPNLFAGSLYQALAAVICFFGLLFILRRFAWGPIIKGLQDREEKIRADLERAERAAAEANATLEQYRRQLAEARSEAHKIIEQSKQDAGLVAQQLKDQAQSDINQMRGRAETEIDAAKKQAIAEVYEQTADIATQVAGRILRRELDPKQQQTLVDESLRELGEMN